MMMRFITGLWLVAVAVCIMPVTALHGWNRIVCHDIVLSMLESEKLLPNDTDIFAKSGQSIMSDINNIVLTTSGCSRLCDSKGPTPYPDSIPRLTQWLLPVLLLIVNMQFGSNKWGVFVSVIHILGDPIHATWSLLAKVEVWNRSLIIAEKVHMSLKTRQQDNQQEETHRKLKEIRSSDDQANKSGVVVCVVKEVIQPTKDGQQDIQIKHIAVIIASLSEVFRPFNNTENPESILQTIMLTILQPIPSPISTTLCFKTAIDLITSRTTEMLRTYIAIALYLFQVISAFVPALGDSTSPSGVKIGMAILFSFLLPMVLLSNSIGGFSAPSKCRQIMSRFTETVCPEGLELFKARLGLETKGLYLSSIGWEGGGFDYTRSKTTNHYPPSSRSVSLSRKPMQPIRRKQNLRYFFLVLTALIPVFVSCTTAAGVLWTSPTNLTCRHFLVLSVFILWLLSSLLTFLFARFSAPGTFPHQVYKTVFFKDAVVAIAALGFIIGSSCGLFHNCWCSGLGSGGRVYLNPAEEFGFNNRVYYPAWVGGCFGLQLGVFGVVRWGWGRSGFGIMGGRGWSV